MTVLEQITAAACHIFKIKWMNSAPLLCAIMLINQNALPALLYFKIVGGLNYFQ